MDMRLGEGSGELLAMPIISCSCHIQQHGRTCCQ
ncbi:nicotinate-nucleotide--dimethylbenzimidazole phosphoribosyltransferase [Shigella flexneri]